MTPQLSYMLAKQHAADLRATAEARRLAEEVRHAEEPVADRERRSPRPAARPAERCVCVSTGLTR